MAEVTMTLCFFFMGVVCIVYWVYYRWLNAVVRNHHKYRFLSVQRFMV